MHISSSQNPYTQQLATAYAQVGQKPVGLESADGRLARAKPVEQLAATGVITTNRRRLAGEGAQQPAEGAQAIQQPGAKAQPSGEDAQQRGAQALEQKLAQKEQEQERQEIRALAQRDREVRAHEQAHMAAGGPYAGAAKYQYEKGPDGVNYAVAGEVPIDTSPEATPEATLQKARTIKRAAMAPAEPSPQDRQVAMEAAAMELEARQDLIKLRQNPAQNPLQENATAAQDESSVAATATAPARPDGAQGASQADRPEAAASGAQASGFRQASGPEQGFVSALSSATSTVPSAYRTAVPSLGFAVQA
jgi:hypothetical protein